MNSQILDILFKHDTIDMPLSDLVQIIGRDKKRLINSELYAMQKLGLVVNNPKGENGTKPCWGLTQVSRLSILETNIVSILKQATPDDLQTITNRIVRQKLDEQFGSDFFKQDSFKQDIRDILARVFPPLIQNNKTQTI